jgi:hypothetical protein
MRYGFSAFGQRDGAMCAITGEPSRKSVQQISQHVTPSIIALVKTPPLHCMLLVL